jgi:hypothetical protein
MNLPEERFWKYVYKTDGCWFWIGTLSAKGYGQLRVDDSCIYAHHLSYRIHFGDYDGGLWILHKCDTTPCVNPEHLYAGTRAQNIQDKILAGHANGKSFQTHCKRGHELSGDNVRFYGPTKSYRACRACFRLHNANRRDSYGIQIEEQHDEETT